MQMTQCCLLKIKESSKILMTALDDKYKEYGMVLNEKRTKVMLISKEESYGSLNITINGKKLQEVKG